MNNGVVDRRPYFDHSTLRPTLETGRSSREVSRSNHTHRKHSRCTPVCLSLLYVLGLIGQPEIPTQYPSCDFGNFPSATAQCHYLVVGPTGLRCERGLSNRWSGPVCVCIARYRIAPWMEEYHLTDPSLANAVMFLCDKLSGAPLSTRLGAR